MRVERIGLELAVEMVKGKYGDDKISRADLFKEIKSLSDFFERRLERNLPKAEPCLQEKPFFNRMGDEKERSFDEGWEHAKWSFHDMIQIMRTASSKKYECEGTLESKALDDCTQKLLCDVNSKLTFMRPPETVKGKLLLKKKNKNDC